jgi:hypothetical protein
VEHLIYNKMSTKKRIGRSDAPKKALLSFGKLAALLGSKGYTLVTVYCSTDGDVHFLEARTPKIQKTFIISIPPKYKMVTTSDTEHYKTVVITKLPGGIESRQMDYIAEVKGPLLDCDLLSISSTMLCLCKNNNDVEVYKFGVVEDEPEEDENLENLEEGDAVQKIIKAAKKIGKKMGSKKLKIPEEVEPVNESEKAEEVEVEGEEPEIGAEEHEVEEEVEVDEPEVEEAEEEDTTPIELEFKDENGKSFEGGAEIQIGEEEIVIPGADTLEKDIEKIEKVIEKEDTPLPPRHPKDPRRRDNSIPENIEDVDISLGIIYYSVEIGLFNKKVSKSALLQPGTTTSIPITLEEEIMTSYDTIDDNESDIRNVKLDEVIEMAAKLAHKAKEEVEKCRQEELGLKTQILKLSSVLDHCEKLKSKMISKPEKYVDVKPEIERLYKQTKTTLYEMNVEILRNKDRTDEVLAQYQTSLEELLNT